MQCSGQYVYKALRGSDFAFFFQRVFFYGSDDHLQPVSSPSGASNDCQTGIKVFNQQSLMNFEPPSTTHFQDWAETSPHTETSGSLEGEGKDERVGCPVSIVPKIVA